MPEAKNSKSKYIKEVKRGPNKHIENFSDLLGIFFPKKPINPYILLTKICCNFTILEIWFKGDLAIVFQ